MTKTLGILLAGAWLLAAPALADVAGHGVVLGTDLNAATVHLDGGTVLHVSERTRIVDAQGVRIGLAELPTATALPDGDGWEVTGVESVAFEAREVGSRLEADHIKVLAVPLD